MVVLKIVKQKKENQINKLIYLIKFYKYIFSFHYNNINNEKYNKKVL